MNAGVERPFKNDSTGLLRYVLSMQSAARVGLYYGFVYFSSIKADRFFSVTLKSEANIPLWDEDAHYQLG